MNNSDEMQYGWDLLGFAVGRRVHFWWRHGFWCPHSSWTRGVLVDLGRRKLYFCLGCGIARTLP